MKIWQRYFFNSALRSFIFFLLCAVCFFIAVDFSMQGTKALAKQNTTYLQLTASYAIQLSKFWCLLSSVSFLLALQKTLFNLSAHREILALQTAGVALSALLTPFIILAALVSLASYVNFEWIMPEQTISVTDCSTTKNAKKDASKELSSIRLQDGSELIYQSFDSESKELRDVFWLKNFDEIWHIKSLHITTEPKIGRFIDCFSRNGKGVLEKKDSAKDRLFPEIVFCEGTPSVSMTALENLSISKLWEKTKGLGSERTRAKAHLHYKLAIPLLPILELFSIAPFAFHYSRTRRTLPLAATTLFINIGFVTLLDSMLVLAENQAVPAAIAIWGPLTIYFIVLMYLYVKIIY